MNSIYNYNDPVNYINDYISFQKENSEVFSVRKWSKELGFSSPVTLIDIINRKKKIKGKSSNLIINGLDVDNSEKMYLQAIIERSTARTKEKVKLYDLLMCELRPYGSNSYSCYREKSDLNLFSHWIYMAILSMTNISKFEFTTENIKRNLHFSVEDKVIDNALFDLFENGLLIKEESGKVISKYSSYSSKTDLGDDDVAKFYEIICDLAKKSLMFSSCKREFQAFSVAIPDRSIPLAKEIIRKARAQLISLGNEKSHDNNVVYQGNLMFFPLTKEVE
jgi:uncharacterized protein (TIGR02147 family)